jgi:hypothetical protein
MARLTVSGRGQEEEEERRELDAAEMEEVFMPFESP